MRFPRRMNNSLPSHRRILHSRSLLHTIQAKLRCTKNAKANRSLHDQQPIFHHIATLPTPEDAPRHAEQAVGSSGGCSGACLEGGGRRARGGRWCRLSLGRTGESDP